MNSPIELSPAGCPSCDAPAEIVDRFDLPSTDGPVTHVKVQCLHRHWFTMTAAALGRTAPRTGPRTGEEPDRWDRPAA